MPLHYFTTDSPNKIPIDYKARLEKKLYLVRENPEPIFDLSECNLKQLPHNIFTICRVFRKDALYLQVKWLGTLMLFLQSTKILFKKMNQIFLFIYSINFF